MARNSVVLERRFVPEGKLVMRQGDDGNCAYLLQSGQVQVYREHEGKALELAKLGPGEIFGEMALVFDEKRTATVKTLKDSNLIVITRQSFKQKLKNSDPTIKAIVEMLTKRMISANNSLISQKSNIDDLTEACEMIYRNILHSLPGSQKKAFESNLFPKMQDFIETIKAFQEQYVQKD